ncbi:MAG TPA: TniQ family protein [Streptosporangiaceae bacterium]|nr:TniQ family protein [Streptosporangiaceae bacterium]
MAAIPIRLPPLPGEALDSWLETYACLLHVTVRDILSLAGMNPDRPATDNGHKPWLYQLDEPGLSALSAVTGVPAPALAGMTLARYQGTGLAEVTAAPGMPRTARWWRQLIGSRYCPRCLAGNGGRWMLTWRIPWTFACTSCQVLLADTCPDCGRRHQATRTGQPRHPGRCDLTGLPLPPPRPPRGGAAACGSDPADTAALTLPAGGRVLAAQEHIDTVTAALLTARDQPADMTGPRQYLDDIHTIARAAISTLHGPVPLPPAAVAVLGELGAPPGGTPARPAGPAAALASPSHGRQRQLAPVTAFGVTIADIMLHGRQADPDPEIATWIAETGAARRKTAGPADVLAELGQASPALRAALARPLASRLDTFYQLRYRAVAGPARVPDPGRAAGLAAALPSLLWPGWALRLMPAEGFEFPRYRLSLTIMLAVAATGAADYHAAQELIGLEPVPASRLAIFTARLRQHGVLEPVTAAICQLARALEEHGAQIDYARRRRVRRLSRAQLDVTGWRRQRYFLTHPDTWAHRRHLDRADLPATPVQEQFARLRLIELLTGTHPACLPGPLRLPERRGQGYAEFVLTLPEPMAGYLDQRAGYLLGRAGISEPVAWEPPFEWATGITWPGPHPDDISPASLHPLIQSGLPVRVIAARLGATAEQIRLTAARHPAPQRPPGRQRRPPPEPEPPGADQLAALTAQGYGPRKIARITGCSERAIRQLLTSAGLRDTPGRHDGDIDPRWLREQYQARRRSLKDISAETSVPVETLAAAARAAGIAVRHGISGHAHPLASLGGPFDFPRAVWDAFTRPGAEQRIRNLLAIPGQPGLQQAARHLGIRHASLASQIRQLETITGITFLRTSPDGTITLTAKGRRFAREVTPVLNLLGAGRLEVPGFGAHFALYD